MPRRASSFPCRTTTAPSGPTPTAGGRRFGQKYGNINFYGSLSLWSYSARRLRGAEPQRKYGG